MIVQRATITNSCQRILLTTIFRPGHHPFVSVAAKRLRPPFPLPLSLPSGHDWLLKILAIQGRFVLGLYRRQMKTIGYLGKIEKRLGVPVTTRSWSTIEKVFKGPLDRIHKIKLDSLDRVWLEIGLILSS